MAPKFSIWTRTQREHLRHMAIVHQIEIRLKIAAELYRREMSATEFVDEFGGGSVERISQHFALMAKHGRLRRVGEKKDGPRRRGHAETLYRAPEPPFFDTETWALLPYSLRLAYSWNTFKATSKEMRVGIEGAFFEGRPTRDLTCTPVELDDTGWLRVIAKLDAHLDAALEGQEDAKIRAARTGGELIRAGILHAGFESPRCEERLAIRLADGLIEPPIPVPERAAPIFADDLCREILEELNTSDLSVKGYHRQFLGHEPEGIVRHRFSRLKKLGWIAVIDEIKRRGAREKLYRATRPAVRDDSVWTDVPDKLAKTEAWKTFVRFGEMFKESVVAGTFDLRADRHLSWSILSLDREGLRNAVNEMEELAVFVREEKERAVERIEAGAPSLTMIVALMAGESPAGLLKAP